MTTIRKCYFCSTEKGVNLTFNNQIFCTTSCIDDYIKYNGGVELYCYKCNKLFLKTYLGSHIIDIHGHIHVYCSVKCQFKEK